MYHNSLVWKKVLSSVEDISAHYRVTARLLQGLAVGNITIDKVFEAIAGFVIPLYRIAPSRKHLRTKVAQDMHLTYSKNGGNLGLESK